MLKNRIKITLVQNFISKLNHKSYLLILVLIEVLAILLSYNKLFDYQGCTQNIIREFDLFNNSFNFLYPEMCDELFYFHGFQWINHIYENGFIYQDRPLYLAIGFIIYRFFFVISMLFGFHIDPVSLLLLTSLIIQIFILNTIAYLMCKLFIGKFERFYFFIFFLITLFSFEHRIYFFLPSSSTAYFLIFIFSIYSIKNNKFNGFIYGLLFTVSGYGVVGFLYELISKFSKLKKNIKQMLKNIFLFTIPSLGFEVFRLLIGSIKGEQYGVRYVHAAEEENQQFTWFIRTLFSDSYEPAQICHTLSEFIPCYIGITKNFFLITIFYIVLCLILFIAFLVKSKKTERKNLFYILSFSLFSYLFISFQGAYNYRFIYYSLGFSMILLICFFIFSIDNDLVSISFLSLITIYTLSRNSYEQYTLKLETTESIIFVCCLLLLIYDLFILNKKKQKIN